MLCMISDTAGRKIQNGKFSITFDFSVTFLYDLWWYTNPCALKTEKNIKWRKSQNMSKRKAKVSEIIQQGFNVPDTYIIIFVVLSRPS